MVAGYLNISSNARSSVTSILKNKGIPCPIVLPREIVTDKESTIALGITLRDAWSF